MDDAFVQGRADTGGPGSDKSGIRLADPPGNGSVPGTGLPHGFWRGPWGAQGVESSGGAHLEGTACPHCREPAAVALPGGGGWCAACGGLVAPTGEAEVVCRWCSLSHAPSVGRRCPSAGEEGFAAPPGDGGGHAAGHLLRLLAERLGAAPAPAAGRYVAAVRAAVAAGAVGEVLFAAPAEPLLLALPDRTLVISAGVVNALEDEAQLAFVLGREESLTRHGWIARRYRAGWPAGFWSFRRRCDDASMARAIELSCRVGFGVEAEHSADREALAALVASDYDPQAGARALALLDRASRGTGRFRLSRVRSRLLARSLADVGRPALARLNREVYRRALMPVRESPH